MEDIIEVPLRDKNKHIIAHTILDKEFYETIKKKTIHACCHKGKVKYAIININNKPMRLHILIMGKAPKGFVIDHKNGNGLDNRRCNLRFATYQQNSQNRISKTGKYIGITKCSNTSDRYKVKCCGVRLGTFATQEEAAQMYDISAYLLLGEDSKTNGLISYEESLTYKLEDIITSRKKPTGLPTNIYLHNSGLYTAKIIYNKKCYSSFYFTDLNDAISALEIIKLKIDALKAQEVIDHYNKEITLNEDGITYILIKDIQVLVDNDIWHDLVKYGWYISDTGYISGTVNQKTMLMHQKVYEMKHGYVPALIDHVNKSRVDNRISNLKDKTPGENAHNKSKTIDSTSKYYGVSKNQNRWLSKIMKDGINYYLGSFSDELSAAIIYNNKAKELYGENANLNIIDNNIEFISNITRSLEQTSDYIGVSKANKKWSARITKDEITYKLGYFEQENDAAKAYNEKAIELYHEDAILNLIDETKYVEIINNKLSKYIGVTKNQNKWTSRIRKDGVKYSLGAYLSEKEAALAYNTKAIELYGELAKLNIF